jgi:hypothetical protein
MSTTSSSPPLAPAPAAGVAPAPPAAATAPARPPDGAPSFRQTLRDILGLDLRSLALFRIAIALVILWDLQVRARDLRAFHTDDGFLPVALVPNTAPLSIHVLDGSFGYQATLLGVHVAVTLAFMVGWQTRLMALLTWFLQLSMQGRNVVILHGGDSMLRMVLFWAVFLPLGEYWSLDARRRGPQRPPPSYLSAATAAFIGQMIIVYWFAALWKGSLVPHIKELSIPWHTDGTAMGIALRNEALTSRFGVWVRQYDGLMRFLTFSSLYLEAVGPALLLLPFFTPQLRTVVVFAFVGFHLGIDLCMVIGYFPWVAIAAWLALLPPWFWDGLLPKVGVRLKRWGARPAPPLPGAQLNFVIAFVFAYCLMWNLRTLDGPRPDLGVTVETDEVTRELGVEGALVLSVEPGGAAAQAGLRPTRRDGLNIHLGDVITAVDGQPVRRARDLFGLLEPHKVGDAVTLTLKRDGQEMQARATLTGTGQKPLFGRHFPPQVNQLAYALGLDQSWGLFAPRPSRYTGWFVIRGVLDDGGDVDLLTGGPVSHDRPALISDQYVNVRWRRFRMSLYEGSLPGMWQHYGEYLAHEYERGHPDRRVRVVEFHFYVVFALPEERDLPPEHKLLYTHQVVGAWRPDYQPPQPQQQKP